MLGVGGVGRKDVTTLAIDRNHGEPDWIEKMQGKRVDEYIHTAESSAFLPGGSEVEEQHINGQEALIVC